MIKELNLDKKEREVMVIVKKAEEVAKALQKNRA